MDEEQEPEPALDCTKYFEKLYLGVPLAKERSKFIDLAHCRDRLVYQKTIKGHHGCVNALGIGKNETLLASGGDDYRVFIWNIQDVLMKESPAPTKIMTSRHDSNVFSTAFTSSGRRVLSTGNDGCVFVHDVETGATDVRYDLNPSQYPIAVYQTAPVPEDDNIFVACSENKEIEIFDCRCPERIHAWPFPSAFNFYSVDCHPEGRFFVCAGKKSLNVLDFRTGKDIYNDSLKQFIVPRGATHAKWSPSGNGIAIVRPCNVPCYLDFNNSTVTYMTDFTTYSTRSTVKACEFLDETTVITGSESFELFIWHLDQAKSVEFEDLPREMGDFEKKNENFDVLMTGPYTKLEGHRSIPNTMKYSAINGALFSSGVEKIIKTWTLFPTVGSTTRPTLRRPGVRIRRNGNNGEFRPGMESEEEDILLHFDQLIRRTENQPIRVDSDDSDDDSDRLYRDLQAFDSELDMTTSSEDSNNSEENSDDEDERDEVIPSQGEAMEVFQQNPDI